MVEKSYDVIIIGSGVCGALCAWKLADAGREVLLLEAADQPIDNSEREEFRHVMIPNPNRGDMHAPYAALASRRYAPAPENAGKPQEKYYDDIGPEKFKAQYNRLSGGATWSWRGNTPRFVPNDFILNTKYHISENWPINYDDLEPWYLEAEIQLGVAGSHEQWNGLLGGRRSKAFPLKEIPLSYGDNLVKKTLDGQEIDGVKIKVVSTPQARLTSKYRPHGDDRFDERRACEGNSNCIPLCPSSAKYDAAVHLRAALRTGNVELKPACVVTKLMTNGGNRVTSVLFKNWRLDDKHKEHTATAKSIIIAANAIETPKLLLMSNNLANSSDQVGRNLMDHVQEEVTGFFPEPLYPFRGPQSTCSIEDFHDGSFREDHSAFRMTIGNDGHGRAKSPINVMDEYLDKEEALFGEELRKVLSDNIPCMLRIGFSTEMLPNPNNRVTLSNNVDELEVPRPQIDFRVDSYTYDGLKKGHEVALSILESIPNIDKTRIKEREWNRKWNTAAHIMGTCRMGNDAKRSVVNTDGQTYDCPNLYIVGSSVFTTGATANPTLTAAALALKTADVVLRNN